MRNIKFNMLFNTCFNISAPNSTKCKLIISLAHI